MLNDNVSIVFKNVKHSSVRVKPTCEVVVTVPEMTPQEEIERILVKRHAWIETQLALFQKNKPLNKELVSGESIEYLGKNYRLKVIESPNEDVKLARGYINIYVKDKANFERKKRLLDSWYKEKAQHHFKQALKKYNVLVNKEVKTVSIRAMKTRWGSCNPSKSYINLNLELIKKPKMAIEYVVLHELTHLIHLNHDQKFYHFLTLHMPDWKKRKANLEQN
ncbi:SprT family zinc-dependent metalloprotease [unclassified Poseidonibacter] [Sulfurospirillum sp. 'SP']|nr:SprT family zinc-dependent metalloprotease [unclassified Poseidonibacter] [Sulfurospirillum sp. 'SP']